MRVSVVTISYNQADFLERAIGSVIRQNYKNIEYIVVDPGSTDGSRDIIEKYRDQIDHVIFEPDDGPADGLNKGFALATGDLFCYINADDALLPDAISRAVFEISQDKWVDVVYGDGYIVDENGQITRVFYSDYFTPWLHVHGAAVIMQQSTFFKRTAFERVGGFNRDNHIWWDGELVLDMALCGCKLVHVAAKLSIFTMHSASISSQKFSDSDRARELNEQRKMASRRLYEKVMKHPPSMMMRVKIPLARMTKWIISPQVTLKKFFSRIFYQRYSLVRLDPDQTKRIQIAVYSHTYLDAVNRRGIIASHYLFDMRVILPDHGPVLLDTDRKLVLASHEKEIFRGFLHLPLFKSQYLLKSLTLGLREYRPDIILVEYSPWSLMFLQAFLVKIFFCRQAKLVSLVKKNTFFSTSKVKKLVSAFFLRLSDHVLAASEMAEKMLAREFCYPERKVHVVNHLAVDIELFFPDRDKDRQINSVGSAIVIGYCGRFEDIKGLPDLIEAVRMARSRDVAIPLELKLLGGGGYHSNMDEELSVLSQQEPWLRIFPPVTHSAVAGFLRDLDIFVMPSRVSEAHQEHDGQALLEALASGVACIGTRSGIIPEILAEGVGIVVEPEKPSQLAQAISELVNNSERRNDLAVAARKSAESKHSFAAVAATRLTIYRDILND